MSEIIRSIEAKQLRTDIPAIAVGDTVKVMVKVVEGKTERLQAFEGVVIAKRNGGIRETFTVRRVSYGIGVERTFSPSGQHHHHPSRQGASRQAVLPAFSAGSCCEDQGSQARLSTVRGCGTSQPTALNSETEHRRESGEICFPFLRACGFCIFPRWQV